MSTINERLVLEDQFSASFNRFISLSEQAAGNINDLRFSLNNVETATAATAQNIDRLANEIANMSSRSQESTERTRSLVDMLKQLGVVAAGVKSAQWLASASDTMAQTTARLDMMNDGLQTTEELTQMVYQAAQNSRGAFSGTADMVGKLGTLAGDAFGSSGEIVAFAEQLNKQIVLSGASTQAADAAMLQLTQAMSSGVLRGEELNSILEQTPMVAQTIANYMGVTTGEMRELASEGQVTADVVKNAILGAADETNAAFESMPMTWGQVWTSMQNMALMALQPVLNGVNWLANNIDIIAPIVLGAAAAFGVFQLAANWTKIATAATQAWTAAQAAFNAVMSLNPVALVTIGIILLVAAVYAGVAAFNKLTDSSVSATGIIAGVFAVLGAFLMNTFIIPLQNKFAAFANFFANLFNDPVTAVKVLFYDLAITVIGYIQQMAQGIENLINAIPGVEVNLTSGIDSLYNTLQSNRQAAIDSGSYKEYVKAWDYKDYADAFSSGYNWGENFNPLSDMFNYDSTGYGGTAYSDLASDVSDIAGNTSSINKAVNMADEDLKNLVDMAERQYVNKINLTAQTPVITINGANTGKTQADRQNLANTIRDILIEQVAAGSTRATARQYSGG